jgi:hypothetical protein
MEVEKEGSPQLVCDDVGQVVSDPSWSIVRGSPQEVGEAARIAMVDRVFAQLLYAGLEEARQPRLHAIYADLAPLLERIRRRSSNSSSTASPSFSYRPTTDFKARRNIRFPVTRMFVA